MLLSPDTLWSIICLTHNDMEKMKDALKAITTENTRLCYASRHHRPLTDVCIRKSTKFSYMGSAVSSSVRKQM